MDANSNDGEDFTAWDANRKSVEKGRIEKVEAGGSKKGKGKVAGDGQTLDGPKKHTNL